MPVFFALVDAMPGQEKSVETALADRSDLKGYMSVREGSHDFLVAFEETSFSTVDDFLRTYIRPIGGVMGVEIVQDFDDYGPDIVAAAKKLQA